MNTIKTKQNTNSATAAARGIDISVAQAGAAAARATPSEADTAQTLLWERSAQVFANPDLLKLILGNLITKEGMRWITRLKPEGIKLLKDQSLSNLMAVNRLWSDCASSFVSKRRLLTMKVNSIEQFNQLKLFIETAIASDRFEAFGPKLKITIIMQMLNTLVPSERQEVRLIMTLAAQRGDIIIGTWPQAITNTVNIPDWLTRAILPKGIGPTGQLFGENNNLKSLFASQLECTQIDLTGLTALNQVVLKYSQSDENTTVTLPDCVERANITGLNANSTATLGTGIRKLTLGSTSGTTLDQATNLRKLVVNNLNSDLDLSSLPLLTEVVVRSATNGRLTLGKSVTRLREGKGVYKYLDLNDTDITRRTLYARNINPGEEVKVPRGVNLVTCSQVRPGATLKIGPDTTVLRGGNFCGVLDLTRATNLKVIQLNRFQGTVIGADDKTIEKIAIRYKGPLDPELLN